MPGEVFSVRVGEEGGAVEGISGIGGVTGGTMPVRMNSVAAPSTPLVGLPSSTGQTAAANGTGKAGQLASAGLAGMSGASATQEMASLSSLSINQSSEMLMVSQAPQGAITNNELLGAVLLMLIMEYMKSTDDKEKEGLLALMGMILQSQQAQQGGGNQTLLYMSNSLSVESTQMQYMSGQAASNAYTNAGVAPAAGGDGGTSLNVVV
jgi:hypothetical protein